MKAAILTELNKPLVIGDVTPAPLSYGQVLVRVLVSGICGAQLQEIRGEKGNARFLPHLLGHEGCGMVLDVGVGVTRVKVGDKVVMHWRKADGIESPFPQYTCGDRILTSGRVTTFSEQSICSENRLTPVRYDTPPELCALLGCGLSTALATIENEAALRFGESILIVGCGGLGQNLIRAARLAQAGHIAAMDVQVSKQPAALALGADVFIHFKNAAFPGTYDVIVDTSGAQSAIELTLPHLKPSGRYVMVGHPPPDTALRIFDADHLFGGEGKTLRATQGGGFQPHLHMDRYIRLWLRGVLKVDDIITHRLKLDQINDGIDLVRNGLAGRVLVEMN